MLRLAIVLAAACSATMQTPRADLPCTGPVSCGREQLLEADQALQHAVQKEGLAAALDETSLPDFRFLSQGHGLAAGREQIEALLRASAPFTWTLARGDVSARGDLGYTFGWTSAGDARGHYAAVWKRRNGEWKLAVFLHKPARAQELAPPAWFGPFRGEREAPPLPAESVAQADAAFAALARRTGSTQQAFTNYAAQDAVQLGPTILFGRDAIHEAMAHAPLIEWGPIADECAADLGYTVGAYRTPSVQGNYLTIWRLESDGAWRYVLDGGVTG